MANSNLTEGEHNSSRIININRSKIIKYLKSNGIPIITGFQGLNLENRITTLGRGGSDTSAIMMLQNFLKLKNVLFILMLIGVYDN